MDTELDRLFDTLNRECFAGRLPKYRVRTRTSQCGEYGCIDEEEQTIWICHAANLRTTLLHEMCHIGTPGHGRAFRAKLRRLAALGERWAREERAYYLRQERGIPGSWNIWRGLANDLRQGAAF